MTQLLAMFPGQGAQSVGMGKTLLEEFPYTKLIFEEAEDSIKLNLRKLCFEGPEDDLKLTANQQPSILTVSSAYFKVLKEESGFVPSYYAGHSLGEYSALVAADKLVFSDAVRLVRLRGKAMQSAVPPGKGAMAAVMGKDLSMVEGICESISSKISRVVQVVNYNSPGQWIISGHKEAVEKSVSALKEFKLRTTLLPVSAPFHSSLMKPARDEMAAHIIDDIFKENDLKIIANLTGRYEASYGVQHLLPQIDSPVLWSQTIESAIGLGCDGFVDVGPGKVMFNLIKRSLSRENLFLETSDLKEAIQKISSI